MTTTNAEEIKTDIKQYFVNFSANSFDNLGEINDFLITNESLKIDTRRTFTRKPK